jgi:alkanesulfonate monooxygenase SsuD/methylene tetrahydromethanopterin reductase-like flavin-dependent oxidoreductase (luciferase family)
MTITLSLTPTGSHPASWRLSPLPPLANARDLRDIAKTAERIGIDAILLGVPGATASDLLQFDPLPMLGALIAATQSIGLCASWSIDFSEPYHVARVFATLDHLSHGRTGWMPLLSTMPRLRPRIGRDGSPDDPTSYCAKAAEFVDITRKLWDSWQDAAWAMDKPSGMFVNPDKVAPIDYHGTYFAVRGPLNVPRPPQGRPVLLMSDPTEPTLRTFVAETADVVLVRDATDASAFKVREVRVIVDLLVVLGETEATAQARAEALDAMAPSDLPRFVGTPAQLADRIAALKGVCGGVNLLPAVLPFDLDLLAGALPPARKATTMREHFGLRRPASQYERVPA